MAPKARGLLALGALGALGLGASRFAGIRRQVKRAAPGLGVPTAYVPLTVSSATLPLLRRGMPALLPASATAARPVDIPTDAGARGGFLYEPASGSPRGALLWIHGGGRVMGSPAQDHELCQRLADDASVRVLSTSYRMAPEHPFPAALDDCAAALTWLVAHCAEAGVPAVVAVGGASAGGGLAAELAQWALDHDVPVDFQLLLYPMLDDRTLDHGAGDRGHLVWTPQANRFGWSAYLGHPAGQAENRPYAVGARRDDLTGLPPAWIGVGDLDLFYEEDCAYAERLRAAGVPVELHVEKGMYHGADAIPGTSETDAVRGIRGSMAHALAAAFTASTPA